ncbi:MAG TPA: glycoside hydrolase domain-containing protein [Candidatus Acidoferrum sp.]|nr:glycoside hydrolase domain-containing protein [Candidatus Acidoferrum sp.]
MRFLTVLLFLLFVTPAAFSPPTPPQQSFLGFDRNDYPGDEVMNFLRKDLAFTGYWLGNPPQTKSNTWSGKREYLHSKGWGFLLLFSGPESGELRNEQYTLKRAENDGQAAANAARREGFPSGSLIFLDVEEGGRLPSVYVTYLKHWISSLLRQGFRAGVYCSGIPVDEGEGVKLVTADFIRDQIKPAELSYWVFNDSCPPSPGCEMSQSAPSPEKSGVAFAQVWQFVRSPRDKETARHCRGYAKDGNCYAVIDTARKFHLDLNVAKTSDPSAPR